MSEGQDLTEEMLEKALISLKEHGNVTLREPLLLIIPEPVQKLLAENGYDTEEKVRRLVEDLTRPYRL